MIELGTIKNRCPSCGHDTLFIGEGGWLTCSWLDCKSPGLQQSIEALQADRETLERTRLALIALFDALMAADPTLPIVRRHTQVVTRLHVTEAGQRYMHAPAAAIDARLATAQEHLIANRYDDMRRKGLQPTTADGHERCDHVDTGRQCTGMRFHADSMNATPHSYEHLRRRRIPIESPDDPGSSRRRGSAGNWEELNGEITGPGWTDRPPHENDTEGGA